VTLRSAHFSSALAFAAIVVAAFAEYSHIFSEDDSRSILLFVLAAILFGAALAAYRFDVPTHLDEPATTAISSRKLSNSLVVGILAAALLTFFLSSDNEFNSDNVLAWLVSITMFLYAFWLPQKNWTQWRDWARSRVELARGTVSNGYVVSSRALLLSGIILLGIFFYFYNLDGVPAEMTSDHAEKILDVNDVVNRGLRPIFFERNTGREPLEFYLIAALVNFGDHPIDHMALKLVTAATGVLVIPGVFFLARELFAEEVAFVAAALVAVSKWPLTIARMGLRFPFTPVLVAPLCFFLFRGFKRQSRNDFLMAGVFLGFGLYGYNAFRLAPLLVIIFVAMWLVLGRRFEPTEILNTAVNVGLMLALAFVIFIPLFRYSIDLPGEFWYRALTRVSDAEQPIPGNPLQVLVTNVVNGVMMFNWTGDEAWPNTIPGDPALDYLSGGIFFLGALYAIYRLLRYREWAYGFVIVGLVVMQLPSSLSLAFPAENPSVVRAGGAIPFAFILAALPIVWLERSLREASGRAVSAIVVLLLFVIIVRANYLRYFRDFDQSYRQSSWNATEVASVIRGFLNSVGDANHVYIMLWPHWIDTRNVAINIGRIGWDQTLPNADDAEPMTSDPANKLFILNPNDDKNLSRLQEIFPSAVTRIYHSRTPTRDFIVMYVPGTVPPVGGFGAP
jgi:dolichyl-phosphate-mannose-protein mannosyltransferase